jgi:hypothetical protein
MGGRARAKRESSVMWQSESWACWVVVRWLGWTRFQVGAMGAILVTAPPHIRVAEPVRTGDRIELNATSHLGVPLHPDPLPPYDDFQRVPDLATALVLDLREAGHLLKTRVESDSSEGSITSTYVSRVLPITPGPFGRPWRSPRSCCSLSLACKNDPPDAYAFFSDHCPIVFEVQDHDRD